MNKYVKTRRIITISATLACMCLCILIGYKLYLLRETYFGNYPRGTSSYSSVGVYEIDPETILSSLDQGNMNVFTPFVGETGNYPYPTVGHFQWKQSDYLKITNALYELKVKENISDWNIYSMIFNRGCSDDLYGFDIGEISYFKIEGSNTSRYILYDMLISPINKGVVWDTGGYYPRPLLGWTKVDLNSLKVAAEDALQMAEENGGKEARLKVYNECEIHLIINPTPVGDNDWKVSYINHTSTHEPILFEIHIDPYSGKHKISVSP
ncbi:MAG: hypothetical protein U0Z26_04850 [Anaerolineales bacterium]